MSEQKILNSRITQKIDTTANWEKATNFIPLRGEIIYYQDSGQPIRYKVGDGILQSNGTIVGTKVNDLPFANEVYTNTITNGIVYDNIAWETVLGPHETYKYSVEGNTVGHYLGIEGEEPFEEIHYELVNPDDGDNAVRGEGTYYTISSDPAGEYFYLSITLPDKYKTEEYYGKKLYLANSFRTETFKAQELITSICAGNGISLTNEDGETTISADLVNLSLSAEDNPADKAPTAASVAGQMTLKSEGVNANYNFTSPGWKRVLNIIRATNGNLNLGIAKTTNGKVTQALGIDFTGYVKFPNEDFRKGKPVIYQRYNNLFGLDPAEYPEKRAQITKVRIGYPTSDYGTNPVNCYVDIYVDFEPREGSNDYVAFNMSYSGKAASHNTSAIITETPAEDVGIYGEELQYYEFEAKVGPDIYTKGEIEASKFTGDVEADKVSSKELFTIGEETRNFNVTGNFADVKVDKSAFIEQNIGEITNMDNSTRDTEGSGDYIVEAIEPNESEGRIIFTDGSYLDIVMITSEGVYQEGIHAGDTVRFEVDEYGYWYAYQIKGGVPKDLRAYKKYNYLYNILKTGDTVKNGVTITVHDSGAMTLNGTCTKDTTYALFNGYSSTNPIIYLPAGTYKTYGMRFLMWGINEDKANYETILPMNGSRNQFLEHRFTITEPKYIGHASIYLKKNVSWNNKSIVPYLYRIDDTEEVVFDYNASTDTITIINDKVNIKITDRGDLYGTSVSGINSLELDNTTILEDGKVVSNNYTTLVADIPAPSYEYHAIAGEWAHGPTNFEIDEEYIITDIEWSVDGNNIIHCGDYYFGIDSSQDLSCEVGDIVKYAWDDAGGELYLYYRQANSDNTNAQTFKVETKTKLVTIGLNADGSIKAPDSLKQAFKDWLGISDTVVNSLVEQKLDTIAEEGTW